MKTALLLHTPAVSAPFPPVFEAEPGRFGPESPWFPRHRGPFRSLFARRLESRNSHSAGPASDALPAVRPVARAPALLAVAGRPRPPVRPGPQRPAPAPPEP